MCDDPRVTHLQPHGSPSCEHCTCDTACFCPYVMLKLQGSIMSFTVYLLECTHEHGDGHADPRFLVDIL